MTLNCTCRSHGYPARAVKEIGSSTVEHFCTNPWCPVVPSHCPNGHQGPFKAAGIGRDPEAACVCDCIWTVG